MRKGLICICILLVMAVVPVFAGSNRDHQKLYTDICIEQGDTLWSIAGEYMSPEYRDSSAYIQEIMEINHLTDENSIHEGSYLVIPYYAKSDMISTAFVD